MITRSAKIKATWTCHDEKNSVWKMHYVDVTIIQTYTTKEPIELFNEEGLKLWLDLRAYTTIKAMCERACVSNCSSCYCTESSIDFSILRVPTQKGELEKPKVVKPKEVPTEKPEVVKPTVPKYVLEQLDYLEEQARQREEEARLIREEIARIKQRYRIE